MDQTYEMLGKKWSKETIRKRARRQKGEKADLGQIPAVDEQNSKKDYSIVHKLAASGISLEEAKAAAEIKERLRPYGKTISDLVLVLERLIQTGQPEGALTFLIGLAQSALSIPTLEKVSEHLQELEERDITTEFEDELFQVVQSLQDKDGLLSVARQMKSEKDLQSRVNSLRTTVAGLDQEITAKSSKLTSVTEQLGKAEASLRIYNNLRERGFGEPALIAIQAAFDRHGGSQPCMQAFMKFNSIGQMDEKLTEVTSKVAGAETRLAAFHAEHRQELADLEMLKAFREKYKCDNSAIQNLVRTASILGGPSQVFIALSKYKDMGEIETKLKKTSALLDQVSGDLKEKQSQVSGLDVQLKRALPLANEIKLAKMVLAAQQYGDDKILATHCVAELARQARGIIKRENLEWDIELEYLTDRIYLQPRGPATIGEIHLLLDRIDPAINQLSAIKNAPRLLREKTELESALASCKKEFEEIKTRSQSIPLTKEGWSSMFERIREEMKKPKPNYPPSAVAMGIVEGLTKFLDNEVKLRIGEEFSVKFKEEFRSAVLGQVDKFEANWPMKELGEKTPEKVQQLRLKAEASPLQALSGEWDYTVENCPICERSPLRLRFDETEVRNLISGRAVIRGHGHWRMEPISVTLDKIVRAYLMKSSIAR